MALFSFYNTHKPRKFNHQPIYWDPHKEELEKRIQKVKNEMGMGNDDLESYKTQIKGSFVEGTSHLKRSKEKGADERSRTYKNMKLVLAAVLLGLLFWYLIN
jgi:hypothetical protein